MYDQHFSHFQPIDPRDNSIIMVVLSFYGAAWVQKAEEVVGWYLQTTTWMP